MKKIILFILAGLIHWAAFGQFSNGNLEFSLGAAQLAEKGNAYPYWQLGVNVQKQKSIVSFHYFHTKEPNQLVLDLHSNFPFFDIEKGFEKSQGLNLMYGRSFISIGKLNITAASGLSLIAGTKSTREVDASILNNQFYKIEKINYHTIGIPLKANLKLQLFRNLAIGTSIFGNINKQRNFYGADFSFYFGNVLNNVE